jgi:hypothetical protein
VFLGGSAVTQNRGMSLPLGIAKIPYFRPIDVWKGISTIFPKLAADVSARPKLLS